jgi:hypothetical protein
VSRETVHEGDRLISPSPPQVKTRSTSRLSRRVCRRPERDVGAVVECFGVDPRLRGLTGVGSAVLRPARCPRSTGPARWKMPRRLAA